MIYKDEPEGFNPKFEVVSCFIEYNGEILLLHRQDRKPEGNTWGVPAGKIDAGETPSDTIVREIKEETGLNIQESQISYFGKVYVRYPSCDFVYHIFHAELNEKQKVKVNHSEHNGFRWIFPKNALSLPLIRDLDACIKLFYKLQWRPGWKHVFE